eukprot:m.83857 g.83857  ORF g.83857 m.83857 type:complete len:68 (+) comp11248_c0_seq2:1133-1336(+)
MLPPAVLGSVNNSFAAIIQLPSQLTFVIFSLTLPLDLPLCVQEIAQISPTSKTRTAVLSANSLAWPS